MNFVKKYISQKTRDYRYHFLTWYIKHFTPRYYKWFLNQKTEKVFGFCHSVPEVPRPSILKIKKLRLKELIGCEIGVAKGVNAKSILKELNIKQLYLVDSYENENDNFYDLILTKFSNNDNVIIKRMKSSEFFKQINDNSLDFIYIDGNHHYDYVLSDLENSYFKIKSKGFILGHDIHIVAVKLAVIDFCNYYDLEYEFLFPDFFIQKK